MKKKIAILLFILAVAVMQCACIKNKVVQPDENTVVIEVNTVGKDIKGKNLIDYMRFLQSSGEISFEYSSGMVTKINGLSQKSNCYWMLYTSDSEKSNTAWGQIEYNGKLYGSATCGFEELIIKEGCLYIWAYQSF